ncbi:Protein ECT2 [Tupaia chinensis]|uniref:Protein ECT2 n=1 Tax=Tupaia chinensis TaxID=246437 RepID=L9KDH0_TUPCH|nr:Protein ECT2 [Tupaia chinensis]
MSPAVLYEYGESSTVLYRVQEEGRARSLLDISNTPESSINYGETPKSCSKSSKTSTPVPSKQSARWQVAKELYQTESNYVNILATIIQLFQVPLEEEGQRGGPILASEEIKTIFGSIPDIFDVHTKIKDDLEDLIVNWDESKSIGDIFLKYSKDLVKTYPPFVNFFEMSKETIIKCEKQKPRFHAFLKINQAKPECGRQSLVELLIRPVQRLPSVALLLNDLKKHTADDNPDKSTLEKAIGSLKEVMTHINEDKRKTEAQKQIFDVVYEVDGCPANLLSSHRSLVQRVETISLGEHPCDRGEQVTLFLFNDCLEIARKRHKVIGTFRSPHGQTRPPASLKHIHLMPLSQIKKVLDIRETEDCHNAFALLVRPPTEQTNVLLSFQMTSDELPKESWLKMLCRHVANTICKADAENLIYTADPESFEVNTKDMDSTLSRASRAIKKTSKKVTRAFSFSKTPKRALRRALMSSHSSVEGRSPPGSDKPAVSRLSSTSSLADGPDLVHVGLVCTFCCFPGRHEDVSETHGYEIVCQAEVQHSRTASSVVRAQTRYMCALMGEMVPSWLAGSDEGTARTWVWGWRNERRLRAAWAAVLTKGRCKGGMKTNAMPYGSHTFSL